MFDDYLQANDAVRAAVRPFLSGRRTVPYENGVIAVDCVTLLTLNPRAKSTVEHQTTLTPAQLRRVIICNLDTVAMPDLSLTGHQALEAAGQHGPLTLPGLRTDLQEHRGAVVQGVRDLVRPEMHDRIDTEMLRLLASGMTAFIDDDTRAIQQMLYNVGLTMETLGWARPDWVQAVREFSLVRPQPDPRRLPPRRCPSTTELRQAERIKQAIGARGLTDVVDVLFILSVIDGHGLFHPPTPAPKQRSKDIRRKAKATANRLRRRIQEIRAGTRAATDERERRLAQEWPRLGQAALHLEEEKIRCAEYQTMRGGRIVPGGKYANRRPAKELTHALSLIDYHLEHGKHWARPQWGLSDGYRGRGSSPPRGRRLRGGTRPRPTPQSEEA
ncbi:MAG: hypothetical protein A4E19_00360 [Nitrospira sp. SG-bin1]|nr:MAG: hypothetical protein A4E19_00360 [Nitrospira sp. SG-bin1]